MRTRDLFGSDQPVVTVDGFAGPFDLLVRLIERHEVDLLTIALAEVTNQYLDHLSAVELRDPEHLSAFLVVAAKLVLIKSSLLLPRPPRSSSDEPIIADPTDLTERLREYQKFRRVADFLGDRDNAGLRSYAYPSSRYQVPARPAVSAGEPELLRSALANALARARSEPEATVLEAGRVSVAEALKTVEEALQQLSTVIFRDLVATASERQLYVATFLAVLELVRLGRASASQEERFGDIRIARGRSDPVESRGD